jgi:alanine racemase
MMDDVLLDETIALRPTVVTIDLGRLRENVARIRERVAPAKIMGVVKANAYGHGAVRVGRELLACGVDQLGVAFLEEGIVLRRAGIEAPILVLGGIIGNQIGHFIEHDLSITASSIHKIRQIDETAQVMGRRARMHLKLDTGMGRIGVNWRNAEAFFEAAMAARWCDVEGVFSHFAASHDHDPSFTREQLDRFLGALEWFPRHGLPTPTRHMANSGAILQHPDAWLDMVRPGIMLYGVYPDLEVERTVPVRPVMSFRTRVVYFKVARAGTPLGYDATWVAPQDTRVVTLPVGYGDGYRRGLSNRGQVLIGGRRYPIVGRISMDQCMVDIGGDSAYNGDEVVLIGEQGAERIEIEELAELLDTIPYELMVGIAQRVPREYV